MPKGGKTDPQTSEGARLERKAVRSHLRRLMRPEDEHGQRYELLKDLLAWILKRQSRYDAKAGGL